MRSISLKIAAGLALVSAGCAPLTSNSFKPTGLNITSECVTEGKDRTVKLAVLPPETGSSWNIEFDGETPENLKIDTSTSITHFSWTLGQDHLKTIGIKPYQFKLSSSDKIFTVSIAFRTTSEQIVGAFISSLIQLH